MLRHSIIILPFATAGATAVCFKCVWPNRFKNGVLAAKVLKDGFECDPQDVQSFAYEATVLSATK
jgi:hypothetical protein